MQAIESNTVSKRTMSPATLMRITRARSHGPFEWLCPSCGHFNRTRERRGQWRVRCRAEGCHKWFGHGHRLWELSAQRGRKVRPIDIVFPTAPVDVLPAGAVTINEYVP